MKFGLSPSILEQLEHVFVSYALQGKVYLYGSRARGDFSAGSDIDIAIDASALTNQQFTTLCDKLDALPFVFNLDVVRLNTLPTGPFREAIERDKKLLY